MRVFLCNAFSKPLGAALNEALGDEDGPEVTLFSADDQHLEDIGSALHGRRTIMNTEAELDWLDGEPPEKFAARIKAEMSRICWETEAEDAVIFADGRVLSALAQAFKGEEIAPPVRVAPAGQSIRVIEGRPGEMVENDEPLWESRSVPGTRSIGK